MHRNRALYFLYYAGVGVFLGYFPAYLRGLGFSGQSIGMISTAQQLVSVPMALVWGALADRAASPARTLRVCGAGALLAGCALPFVHTPVLVAVVLAAFSAFSGAVVPLIDSATVEESRRTGASYARTRLWGSLGFIVTAQGLGYALAMRGEIPGDALVPAVYLACIAGWALAAQGVPDAASSGPRPHLREALSLLRDPRLLFWLAISALHWGACAPYHLLFGVLVRDRGLPSTVTGASLALGVSGEVLALLALPALLRRFPLRALVAAAFAATALRWLATGQAVSPVTLVLLQSLHAFTFGLFWGCAVEGMTRIVPSRLRASGQALFSAVVFGAGNGAGYALAGRAYDRLGGVAAIFPRAAAVEALALLLLVLPLTPDAERA